MCRDRDGDEGGLLYLMLYILAQLYDHQIHFGISSESDPDHVAYAVEVFRVAQ